MGDWDDTSTLFFFLYAPEQQISRFGRPGKGPTKDTIQSLVFENKHFTKIHVGKGIGEINLSREVGNGKTGDQFATEWKTTNVAEDGFEGLSFVIHNRTEALDAEMRDWNRAHPDDLFADCVNIQDGYDVNVHLYLPSRQFGDLLNLNWREKYLEVSMETSPSIHGLKFSMTEEDKKDLRDDTYYHSSYRPFSIRDLMIREYRIVVKDLPVVATQQGVDYSLLHMIRKIFRFLFSR